MTAEHLRKLWKAEPFQPFTIRLADGRGITIRHPEFLMISPSGRTVHAYADGPGDNFNIIDLPLVTDLEVRSNGSARRRKSRK